MGVEDRPIPLLRRVFTRLRADLEEHLRNEEKVLFPAILELDRVPATGQPVVRKPFGSVRNPIKMIGRITKLMRSLHEL